MSVGTLGNWPTNIDMINKVNQVINQSNNNEEDIANRIPVSQKGIANGVATLVSEAKIDPEQASASIYSTLSSTVYLSDSHSGKLIKCYNASDTCTISIRTNSVSYIPIGTEIEIVRYGAGEVTISPASGVTLYSKDNARSIASHYGAVSLKKMGANEWWMVGDLE